MSKEFNLFAFVANFGRIIDNEIKALRERGAESKERLESLLSDECSFYTGVLYFEKLVPVEEILASYTKLFEIHKDLICNDQLYIENRNEYKKFPPQIKDIIANEAELAECYLKDQKEYIDYLAANNSLLIGESPSQDLHEPTE